MRPSEDFIYAVSRIRVKETKLLSSKHIEQMLSMPDAESVVRFLHEKGWGSDNQHFDDSKSIISLETRKLWELIKELGVDLSDFDFIRIQNDFHNLKASVKAVYTESDAEHLFISGGKYDAHHIYSCVKASEFSSLPEVLSLVAEEAYKTLLKTSDGQLCDMIIDKACLSYIYEFGKNCSCSLIKEYCELYVASSDIKIAIRGAMLQKSYDFMVSSMSCCDSLDIAKLSRAASKGLEEVISYIQTTDYRYAVEHIKKSLSAFEKWCDNKIMSLAKQSKSDPFTIAPIAAYIFAKQNEMKAVRLILTAKENYLDASTVSERIRDMYV